MDEDIHDDIDRDVGAPLAGDDDDLPELNSEREEDDLDDNFDRELREAERELEETDQLKQELPEDKNDE